MKIGYLMNTYPMVSSTFIGREIEGLEARGVEVARFALRRWSGTLVDPRDIAEGARTDYILSDGAVRLVAGLLAECVANPRGMVKTLKLWGALLRNAGGGPVRHVAYLLEAVALRRRLRKTPVAHIHAHFSTNAAAIAMMVRALGGPGYSFTIHGPDELFEPARNSLGLKIAHADFVACISHFCRSQCMIFSDPADWDRLRIVHCGVLPARYAPDDDAPARTGTEALYVGRMSQLKGCSVLLDAFAEVRAANPAARLTMIGDGDQRPALEGQAADLGIADAVEFAGFRTQTEVRAAMARADMLVLASFAEGVPVVLMEAMASGIPVVAPQVAGVGELVENGVSGYVAPAGDARTYAARMSALFADPDLRARMGAAGRAKVAAEFDIDGETAWLHRLIEGAVAGEMPDGLRPAP